MNKNYKLKKGIFYGLFCIEIICSAYFFLSVAASMDFSGVIAAVVYKLHIDKYVFTEMRMLAYIFFIAAAVLIAVFLWLLYRKETGVPFRIAVTALPVISALPIPIDSSNATGVVIGIILCAVYVIIGIFIIRGAIKYLKTEKQKSAT